MKKNKLEEQKKSFNVLNNLIKKLNCKVDIEYDKTTGLKIKQTVFHYKSQAIWFIDEFLPKTEIIFKSTVYYPDGKTISSIIECDKINGSLIKIINFNLDGSFEEETFF